MKLLYLFKVKQKSETITETLHTKGSNQLTLTERESFTFLCNRFLLLEKPDWEQKYVKYSILRQRLMVWLSKINLFDMNMNQ